MRPSGPRTTPGTKGSRLSTLSFWLGAACTVAWLIVVLDDDSSMGTGSLAVTVTVSLTVAIVSSTGNCTVAPGLTSTVSAPFRPGALASTSYVPAGRPSTTNAPVASDSVSLFAG